MDSQLVLEGLDRCGCWVRRNDSGLIVAAHSCSDCVGRALDFLEDLLYLDKVGSVSALGRVEEGSCLEVE